MRSVINTTFVATALIFTPCISQAVPVSTTINATVYSENILNSHCLSCNNTNISAMEPGDNISIIFNYDNEETSVNIYDTTALSSWEQGLATASNMHDAGLPIKATYGVADTLRPSDWLSNVTMQGGYDHGQAFNEGMIPYDEVFAMASQLSDQPWQLFEYQSLYTKYYFLITPDEIAGFMRFRHREDYYDPTRQVYTSGIITIEFNLTDITATTVEISDNNTSVSEPSSLILLFAGLAFMGWKKKSTVLCKSIAKGPGSGLTFCLR